MDTCKKLHRLPRGIFGFSGSEQDMGLFLEWAEGGFDPGGRPELDEESMQVLVLSESGIHVYYSKCIAVPVARDFWAVGSGANIAMGAMAAGCSPTRAVEIACELNAATGPPVVSMTSGDVK